MTARVVFGLALNPDDHQRLTDVVRSATLTLVSSVNQIDPEMAQLLTQQIRRDGHVSDIISRVFQVDVPHSTEQLARVVASPPEALGGWCLRNALLMEATQSLVFLVNDATCHNLDVTAHLVLARALNIPSVGLLEPEARLTVESTQLTYASAVCGTGERRVLARVLRSLTEGAEQQPPG